MTSSPLGNLPDVPDADDTLRKTPEYHDDPRDVEEMAVEYDTRGPGDWVLSGPLGVQGGGPGRRFATIKQAEAHVKKLHGDRVVRRIKEATLAGRMRWAYLIKARTT